MTITVLPSNRPAGRFYRGGRRITDFRGEAPAAGDEPEDWIASVTAVRGEAPAGQTVLPDGRLLADAVAEDPQAWLGPAHTEWFGADPMLLVKLLDAGQRLPVHAHPDGRWAAAHVGASHGKTEAWYILTEGDVHLALARDLPRAELDEMVERQDTAALLAAMHRLHVGPGDVVLVPAGVLHAIGEGILLVEIQEPEDLSILVEWTGFAIDGRAKGHLGVGFGSALEAVERTARSEADVRALVHRAGDATQLLPPEADPFFRLEHLRVDGSAVIQPGFAVIVVLDGRADATREADDSTLALARGATAVLPYAAGAVTLRGRAELVVCRPPLPR